MKLKMQDGHPDGLEGEDITLEARIIAVADTVEAMSSHRPYRAALGVDVALSEIKNLSGSSFDPQIVDACLEVFKSL
jgi:HD-GYP domain-containing protein (c-di-GMP phosphodiesterase class II)